MSPRWPAAAIPRTPCRSALAGRRAASEIRRWNWSGEPDPWLAAIPSTGEPRETELHEHDPRVPPHMRDREFLLSAADPNF
jgi:hypothetical protein